MMAVKAGVKVRGGVFDTTNEDQRMFSHDQNSDPGQVIMKTQQIGMRVRNPQQSR